MRLTEYFTDIEGLSKLLADYQPLFDMIDDYGQQLIQGVISNPNDYKQCLDKLTGAFISLEPLYSIAESVKLNQELQAYVSMKRELENKGEKVVAASLEKESSLAVADFRRTRAILEGYVEACAKGISTCQTQLKSLDFEIRNRNSQINE